MPEVERRGYFRIDLANNCNIRCVMCQAYNSLPVSAMQFLDFDLFVKNTRGELGKWAYIQLGNVAEASIHPKFADFLRYVRSEAPDSTIHIVTNAKTLHKFATLINELGNCLVQISMDSIRKDVHEYIREGSNYDRALANIAMLDVNRTRVLLSFTLMRSNIEEYPEMIEYCRERGYHMSAFPMIVRSEYGVVPFNLLKESLWFSRDLLRTWLEDYYGKQYEKMIGTASGANQGADEFNCNAHYQDLNLDAMGTVNLCGKVTLGNLQEQDLHTLWHGFPATDFRLQVDTDREPCMTCDYRQRCLAPSMAIIDNHFSEEIIRDLPDETRQALRYDRDLSEDESRWRFVRDLGTAMGIFDISNSNNRWVAHRVLAADKSNSYTYRAPLEAATRHQLHDLMRRQAESGTYVELLEAYGPYNLVSYRHKYWALPMALGRLNITHDGDRRKPGILVSDSMEELKLLCDRTRPPSPPRLLGSANNFNLVAYDGKFWGIPLSFGPFNITDPQNQSKDGVRVANSLAALRWKCGVSLVKVLADVLR